MTRFLGIKAFRRPATFAALAVLALSGGPVWAQNPFPGLGAPAAPAPAAPAAPSASAVPQPTADMPWQKICETNPQTNQEVCSVRADIRDDNGVVMVRVALQKAPNEERYGLIVFAPLGVLLPPGIVIAIDGARALALEYQVCVANPTICVAQSDASQTLIDQMKRGGQMTFTLGAPQRTLALPLSLRGFTRTFDGPGIQMPAGQGGATPAPAP
jgi:invasion protein IalB